MSLDRSKIHFNCNLLALEMEKRDIKVSLVPKTNVLKATYKNHVEYIDDTDISLMPSNLRYLLDDKWKGKMLLKEIGLSVIKGQLFTIDNIEKAKEFAKKIGFPVVIKTNNGSHGYNVRMNIDNETEFEDLFEKLAMETHFKQDILVEEQVSGNEFRLIVTRNGFFAAVYRIPANIKGNGKDSLKQLVDNYNKKLLNNRVNCLCPIWLDSEAKRYLNKKGIDLNYIPSKGEKIFLRSNSNVSTGGGCMDVTDIVHPYYIKLAFKIIHALVGLPYVGIDLITNDIRQKGKYYICEANPAPGISLHTHPGEGTSRDLPKALIDMLFPETIKNLQLNTSNISKSNRNLKK